MFGPELRVNDLLKGPGTDDRKDRAIKTGFACRPQDRKLVARCDRSIERGLQARVIEQVVGQPMALFLDG